MKKDMVLWRMIVLGALFMAFFVGCSQPTIETPKTDTPEVTTPATTPTTETKPYYVKNSKWEDVDISKVSTARSVTDPSVDEALAIIEAYNAENNDDQLRLYMTDVPITEAPTVDVYIAKAVDGYYVILVQVLGMERAYYAQNKQVFEQDATTQGGVLFVDKVPETVPVVVVPVDTRTRHEKYSVYMVSDKTNKIVVYNGFKYEIHCDEEWDALNGTGPSLGYPTIDDYFAMRVDSFYSDLRCVGLVPGDAPWRVVYGQIYVEPTDPAE